MATGVYLIRCTVTGKAYVGSASVSIAKRWGDHRSFLRSGKHQNRYLQAAWNKHGEPAFEFVVLEECEPDSCVSREQFWIDEFRATDRTVGFNARPRADSNLGFKHSDESRANMSAALRCRVRRKETYEKIAAVLRGRGYGSEVRANMSAGQKGKRHSEATKAKMAATRMGRKHAEAHRRAISEGHLKRNAALKAAPLAGDTEAPPGATILCCSHGHRWDASDPRNRDLKPGGRCLFIMKPRSLDFPRDDRMNRPIYCKRILAASAPSLFPFTDESS